MLEDDELDFDDFGDLEGYEGQSLTTEELEKQLALEFDDLPETKPELDEGEIVEDPIEKKSIENKPVTKPLEAPAKPVHKQQQQQQQQQLHQQQQQQQQHQQQNYYNNNNNFYNQQQQQQYTPDMMAMNMFPYPQYSNRIYVNPKFNGGGGGGQINQQQLLQQQQMAQQRQFMEMEAKRMALLQHQQQLLEHKSRAAELDKKRKETAEMMRKRKEMKETNGNDSQVGEKRKSDVVVDSTESEHDTKRPLRQSPAGGISIKGAAAAAARGVAYPSSSSPSPSPSRNIPYTPPHMKKPENNIRNRIGNHNNGNGNGNGHGHGYGHGNGQTTDITSRLGKPEEKKAAVIPSRAIPIVTGGKSNTLTINGFKEDIKEQDIKNMTKDIPGGAQDIRVDQSNKSVTVVFPSIEAAVTFRRKFNRFQIGDVRINVVFQK